MNKSFLTALVIAVFSIGLSAQEFNKVKYDSTLKAEILYGKCTRYGMESYGEFGKEFSKEFHSYQPVPESIEGIHANLEGFSMTIALGTWCSDSQEQVPRMMRVLEMAGYPIEEVTYLAVDRKKTVKLAEDQTYTFEKVPTIMVYKHGKEIGRIIETPQASMEADLLKILHSASSDGAVPSGDR